MKIVSKSDIEFWDIFKICKPSVQDIFHSATVNNGLYKGHKFEWSF